MVAQIAIVQGGADEKVYIVLGNDFYRRFGACRAGGC